jgi:hypothetical protein
VGTLIVVVPSGTAVRVIGSTGAGDIHNNAGLAATSGGAPNPSPTHQGPHSDLDVRTAADPVLVVRADVGLGTLTIDGPTGQEQ